MSSEVFRLYTILRGSIDFLLVRWNLAKVISMNEKDPSESDFSISQHTSPRASTMSSFLTNVLSTGRRKALVGGIACVGLLMILLQPYQSRPGVTRYGLAANHIEDVYNTTLGFQKVFTIGLSERTDKKDLSTLAASFAGFQVEYLPGIRAEDVDPKAAPSTWDYESQTLGALGCWRAHMNVLQKIVAERIQTALITEDDADWSPFIKDQLFELSTGARAIQGSPSSTPSPYGHDWDFLWLGHNRVGPTDAEQNIWVIDNDFTVPPLTSPQLAMAAVSRTRRSAAE